MIKNISITYYIDDLLEEFHDLIKDNDKKFSLKLKK